MFPSAPRLLTLSLALLVMGCSGPNAPEVRFGMAPTSSTTGGSNSNQSDFEVSQGVGFSTSVNTSSSAASASAATSEGMSSNAGAVLAVLGLVALLIVADDVAGCSGSGCGASADGFGIRLN